VRLVGRLHAIWNAIGRLGEQGSSIDRTEIEERF